MSSGWIKLHRSLLEWEWYKKSEYLHVFIHLILKANIEDKKWQNFDIKRGQLITSIDKICIETGVSNKIVRNALDKLILSNEIVKETTNKFTIITICKYDSYQEEGQTKGKQTGKQRATTKEYKNNINKLILLSDYLKSEKKYDFISKKEEVLMKWFLSALSFNGEYFEKSMKLKTSYESLKLLTNVDKVTNSDLCLLIGFIAHASKLKIDNVHLKNIKSISYLTKEESNNDIKRWRSLIESAKEQYAKNKEFKGNIDSMIENLNKYE
jgi:hypothetical protein